jgi:prevent-host-death family protein
MQSEVKIAELKSKLSEYLRSVRSGNEVVIKDRETPIARIIPYEKPHEKRPQRLVIRPAAISLKAADRLVFHRPKGLKRGDADEALRWVRRDRFKNGLL